MEIFPAKLPLELKDRFISLYEEYEKRESLESRFVKIVDIIECEFFIHEKKDFYINWTKDFYESKKKHHFDFFPELLFIHEDMIEFYEENNYF
jgi:hypothetical protein